MTERTIYAPPIIEWEEIKMEKGFAYSSDGEDAGKGTWF